MISSVEFDVLSALCDTFFSALNSEETKIVKDYYMKQESNPVSENEFELYASRNGTTMGIPDSVAESINKKLPTSLQVDLKWFLSLMASPFYMFFLSGYYSRFQDLSVEHRENVLLGFSRSWFKPKRKVFMGLKGLILYHIFTLTTPTGDTNKENKNTLVENSNWRILGYEGPLSGAAVKQINEKAGRADEFLYTMLNDTITADNQVVDGYDVVVVGSGCGGSVVAAELSAAGKTVLVIEKGTYYTRDEMDGSEAFGIGKMFEKGGHEATQDSTIAILAGSTLGGGSTVNWACSLRTPDYVLKEWSDEYGLSQFTNGEHEKSMDYVCERIGVGSKGMKYNKANSLLIKGCKDNDLSIDMAPNNFRGCEDTENAGWIGVGDRYGIKQGMTETFLQDAAKSNTQFIDRCYIEKVLAKDGTVLGVVGSVVGNAGFTYKNIKFLASRVVVSGGSIQSPALLLRSDIPALNASGQIGKNLRIHPVCAVGGIMPENVDMWLGAPMTTVCNQFASGVHNDHYGFKLEVPSTHPGLMSGLIPWWGRTKNKKIWLSMRKTVMVIILCRDRGSGTVTLDSEGNAVLNYVLGQNEVDNINEGLGHATRVLASVGANFIFTVQNQFEGVSLTGCGDENNLKKNKKKSARVEQAIKDMRYVGVGSDNRSLLVSAHQMGTCRMGSGEENSVVGPTGECWGVRGLYVADASVFPTPSGANPMLSVLAISHQTARHIKASF
eukprot:CFRG2585T1